MSRVSIVLPTYNRAATLPRAVNSVLAQTFADWELIVVDDGSTDGSTDRLVDLDPRIHVKRRANGGVSAARNTGLEMTRGELVAFLDSDDEWMPYHLALGTAFFDAFPGEDLLQTELLVHSDGHRRSVFPRDEITWWYPRLARRIGSHLLDLPAGEHDGYMRMFHEQRSVEWIKAAQPHLAAEHIRLYRGGIYGHLRWGYLTSLPAMVITRRASLTAGKFNERLRNAEDFAFMAGLLRAFPLNLLSVTGCVKHDEEGGEHLSHGTHAAEFRANLCEQVERVLVSVAADERERRLILGYKRFDVALAALRGGNRLMAQRYLDASCADNPRFWRGKIVRLILRFTRSARLTRSLHDMLDRLDNIRRSITMRWRNARGS